MNDIWTTENSTLEYYGEFLKEINSKSYLLVIQSYLLKSMSIINIQLADKYKVFIHFNLIYNNILLICLILRNHFWRFSLKKVLLVKYDPSKN